MLLLLMDTGTVSEWLALCPMRFTLLSIGVVVTVVSISSAYTGVEVKPKQEMPILIFPNHV